MTGTWVTSLVWREIDIYNGLEKIDDHFASDRHLRLTVEDGDSDADG